MRARFVFPFFVAACGSSGSPAVDAPAASTPPPVAEPPPPAVAPPPVAPPPPPPGAPPRADVPGIACADTIDAIYTQPSGLSPMSMSTRGAIVRCAEDVKLSLTDVKARMSAKSAAGVTATSGASLYRIAYRTYRNDGVEGLSSARVYLPATPRAVPVPVVAIGHPTTGLASSCAPSKNPNDLDDLALPFAARGFAVIASDYAGLGTAGVQGYVANRDQAHSLLDSARALAVFLAPGATDGRVVLAGYSQGGGAVLAAHALASSYGAGGDVLATIVFAPEYFSRIGSFGYVDLLRSPDDLTITTGVSKPVVAAMRGYSLAYNVLGPASATTTFPASKGADIATQLEALCQTPFGGYIQSVAPHVGDLFDPAFRAAFLACVDGTAGCTGTASTLHAAMMADLLPPDPAGSSILFVQGLADYIMPPNEEAACNLASLEGAGVKVERCVDPPAQHTDVVPRNIGFAEGWAEAVLDGQAHASCAPATLPACAP
jgi:hypothetical protein